MRKEHHYILFIALCVLTLLLQACNIRSHKQDKTLDVIAKHYQSGDFKTALEQIKIIRHSNTDKTSIEFTDSIKDYISRYQKEYPYNASDITRLLREKGIVATSSLLNEWETSRQLEFMIIDNEKRYFKSAVRNLLLLNDSLREVSGSTGLNDQSLTDFCLKHTQEIIRATQNSTSGKPVLPTTFLLHYQTALPENSIPPGQKVNMWMPYPLRNHPRQNKVFLHSYLPGKPLISPNHLAHQSLFLSQKTSADRPAFFETTFEFTSAAQYFHPDTLRSIPFTTLPDSILPYTRQRIPHIVFSDEIKKLAETLTTPDMLPYEMVRSFYYWINDNIPWASAVEYGLIRNIPEYTLRHQHGDCGMQTLLFMSLCRHMGIPARWQSGWMLHPDNVNLHDWCEVWYHGVGWVPVDVSFKLQPSEDILVKEFYLSGIDAYRLIVNTDYGQPLYPAKEHPRSEPWDFQRGEMEWEQRNLYFDEWERTMNVQYLP